MYWRNFHSRQRERAVRDDVLGARPQIGVLARPRQALDHVPRHRHRRVERRQVEEVRQRILERDLERQVVESRARRPRPRRPRRVLNASAFLSGNRKLAYFDAGARDRARASTSTRSRARSARRRRTTSSAAGGTCTRGRRRRCPSRARCPASAAASRGCGCVSPANRLNSTVPPEESEHLPGVDPLGLGAEVGPDLVRAVARLGRAEVARRLALAAEREQRRERASAAAKRRRDTTQRAGQSRESDEPSARRRSLASTASTNSAMYSPALVTVKNTLRYNNIKPTAFMLTRPP